MHLAFFELLLTRDVTLPPVFSTDCVSISVGGVPELADSLRDNTHLLFSKESEDGEEFAWLATGECDILPASFGDSMVLFLSTETEDAEEFE